MRRASRPSQRPGATFTARQNLPIIYLWTFKNVVARHHGFTLVPDGLTRFTGVKYSQ
jgi:hypothetical protein